MKVVFYAFNKEKNETKIPEDNGTEMEVFLKETTSVLNPTLIVDRDISMYNYFFIESFKRYYIVTDIKYISNNIYEIAGEVDVMGSYRNDILNSRQYIERSAVGYNEDIMDSAFPSISGKHRHLIWSTDVSGIVDDYTQGTYIIGTIGSSSGYQGVPVTYYALQYQEMQKLNAFLFNSANYATMVTDDVVKAFFNPMDYIISCMYFPVLFDMSNWEVNVIEFSWFRTDISAHKVNDYKVLYDSWKFNIDRHYSDYRKNSPWSNIKFWCINESYDIPTEWLYNAVEGSVEMEIDLVGGLALIALNLKYPDEVSSYTALRTALQFGCPVSLVQTRQDWIGALTNAAGMAGSAFKFDIAGVAEHTIDAIQSLTPEPTTRGTNGTLGTAFWQKYMILQELYFNTVELNPTRVGRPVEKTDIIRNYSGYIRIKKAEINLNGAYKNEVEEATSIMEGGFYVN